MLAANKKSCTHGVAASTGFAHVIHTLLMNIHGFKNDRLRKCVADGGLPGGTLSNGNAAAAWKRSRRRFPPPSSAWISPRRSTRTARQSLIRGNGSGVIIDQEGRILTNYHVAGRAIEIYVTLANKERVPAKLIGDDHWTDLAVIQMDMDEMRTSRRSGSVPRNWATARNWWSGRM